MVSSYPSAKWELYDLDTDRGETRNVAANYPEVVRELSALYFEWAGRTGVVDYNTIRPERGEVRVSAGRKAASF
ncbi:MAG: hypothetical protein LUE93_07425 [Bacteroides sp.]|nr:hypothetical protein [Bacteroides sp.]